MKNQMENEMETGHIYIYIYVYMFMLLYAPLPTVAIYYYEPWRPICVAGLERRGENDGESSQEASRLPCAELLNG